MEIRNSSVGEDGRVTVSSSVPGVPVSSSSSSGGKVHVATSHLVERGFSTRNEWQPTSSTKKIVSKNSNGTIVVTSAPGNDAELQLYRVMQRASLLHYYDTLLEMGGDDVQQLCDAGEEEFLEIMALVGMASKPLHVRRLQKALQEWVLNPGMFQVPLSSGSGLEASSTSFSGSPSLPPSPLVLGENSNDNRSVYSPSPRSMEPTTLLSTSPCNSRSSRSYSPLAPNSPLEPPSGSRPPSASSSPGPPGPGYAQSPPQLAEQHLSRLALAAERLTKQLPVMEPRPSGKKKMCKELELVMAMSSSDPRHMDQIRKYSAIYGRFDCKRKPEKPLTLHEVSVNEAAAQVCRLMPALLTRRDELFPLARQVVRDSGFNYAKGVLQPVSISLDRLYPAEKDTVERSPGKSKEVEREAEGASPGKRPKLDIVANEQL